MMLRGASNLLVGMLLLLVAGCGFHLRGAANLPESINTMYIQGINLKRDLGLALKRGLESNDVTIIEQPQTGAAVLTVLSAKSERRVLSVGANAKVSEYQLYGTLEFKLLDKNNQLVVDSETLRAVRDYQFDQNQVLASDQQDAQLRQEINDQLVQSLLRRLSAIQ